MSLKHRGERSSFPLRCHAHGRTADIGPAHLAQRVLQSRPIELAVPQKDHLGPRGDHRAHQLDHRNVGGPLGQCPLGLWLMRHARGSARPL